MYMPRRLKNDSSWGWLIGLGVGLIGYQLLKNKEVDAYPTKEPIPERKRNEKLHTQDGPSEPDLKPKKIGTTSFPLTGVIKVTMFIFDKFHDGSIVHIIDGKKYHEGGHFGMDLFLKNLDVYIPINGFITYMDYGSTYGNSIVIENFSGTERWRLAHLEGFSKNLWLYDEVEAGEYAGKIGRTGDVSGAHLHVSLEYKIGGKWLFANPESRLKLENV